MLLLKKKWEKHKTNIIHFVGIGGIGISGIAEIMNNLGYIVQGSDISPNENINRLESKKIKIFIGHDVSNIKDASYVVISSAIKQNNPELIAAKQNKIPIISRSEMLAELMRLKCSIAVSGSHGKTTTTSLIGYLFDSAGLDPTIINGGIINNYSTNAYLGQGDYLIVEADESDATFIKIPSTIGVITNIDPEHMDYYENFDNLFSAFAKFIHNLPFYGFGVACIDHKIVRKLVQNITERRIITYAIDSEDANVFAYNIRSNNYSSVFDVRARLSNNSGNIIIENITIPIPGKHNILNALAALAIGMELGFGIKTIKDGFKDFKGVERRFSKIGEHNGIEIIDDYAHHPTEIKATLSTARNIANVRKSKIIAIFQPHRYSRLNSLFTDFTACFDDADILYITDVYSAGEKRTTDIDSASLVDSITKQGKNVQLTKSQDDILYVVNSQVEPGDLVIFMGAGDITKWAYQIAKQLNKV